MENPYLNQALEYIANNDLNMLPIGKSIIDEDNIWVNIIETELKSAGEAKFEVHNNYIDIQIPLSGSESYGIKERSKCAYPIGEFNNEKDYLLYEDSIKDIITLKAGEKIIIYPDTAHAPLIGVGNICKAVFKVRVNE